jgi:hypothetical protein
MASPRGGPRAGDLFTVRGRRLVGRVVSTTAVVGPTHGCLLVYVYADARLSRDALLVPPMLATRAPFSRGLFEPLRSEPLLPGYVLAQHAFRDAAGHVLDEEGRPVKGQVGSEVERVGEYRLFEVEAVEALLARTPGGYEVPAEGPPAAGDVTGAVREVAARWVAAFGRPPTREEWGALYDVSMDIEDDTGRPS